MKLVVNTNRIIATLIKDSISRQILFHIDAELLTLSFSQGEITKYKEYVLKKAGINDAAFDMLLEKIKERLIFVDDTLIRSKMPEAEKIMDTIDTTDTPFIAAALATKSDIWSDDKHFQQQKSIQIWQTKDLIKFI